MTQLGKHRPCRPEDPSSDPRHPTVCAYSACSFGSVVDGERKSSSLLDIHSSQNGSSIFSEQLLSQHKVRPTRWQSR